MPWLHTQNCAVGLKSGPSDHKEVYKGKKEPTVKRQWLAVVREGDDGLLEEFAR